MYIRAGNVTIFLWSGYPLCILQKEAEIHEVTAYSIVEALWELAEAICKKKHYSLPGPQLLLPITFVFVSASLRRHPVARAVFAIVHSYRDEQKYCTKLSEILQHVPNSDWNMFCPPVNLSTDSWFLDPHFDVNCLSVFFLENAILYLDFLISKPEACTVEVLGCANFLEQTSFSFSLLHCLLLFSASFQQLESPLCHCVLPLLTPLPFLACICRVKEFCTERNLTFSSESLKYSVLTLDSE